MVLSPESVKVIEAALAHFDDPNSRTVILGRRGDVLEFADLIAGGEEGFAREVLAAAEISYEGQVLVIKLHEKAKA